MYRIVAGFLIAAAIVSFSAIANSDEPKTGTAGEVTVMPVIEVMLPARILQCIEPRIPESDCVRVCLTTLGDDACLEIVMPWKAPAASQ